MDAGGTNAQGDAVNQLTVVRFRVRYRLGEYLEVVRLHAQASPALAAAGSWRRGCCLALLSLFATGVFSIRAWQAGSSHFHIDLAGLRRRSRRGVTFIPWAEVMQISETAHGYLVRGTQSWLLLPFRGLSSEQQGELMQMFQVYARTSAAAIVSAPMVPG